MNETFHRPAQTRRGPGNRPPGRSACRRAGFVACLAVTFAFASAAGGQAALGAGQSDAVAGRAGGVAGPAIRHGVDDQPAPTATQRPATWLPGGKWQAVHSAKKNPLWSNNPPALQAVHGAWSGGKWIAWAVGDKGTLVYYDGQAWQVKTELDPKNQGSRVYNLRDVFVAAANDVWAVGMKTNDRNCESCGFILHYDGANWRELDKQEFKINGRVSPINALDMVQDEQGRWWGWAVGDDADFDVIKAIIIRFSPTLGWRVYVGPNNNAIDLQDIKTLSPREAWAVGTNGIEAWYLEDASGKSDWARLGQSGSDSLYTIDMADPLFGWDGGNRGRMNWYYGQCHDDDLNTQCWFDNQAIPVEDEAGNPLNLDVYSVDLYSRTQGWVVGKVYTARSLVARLDAATRKWVLVPVVDDPGETLGGLYMRDLGFAVAVGVDGAILEYHDSDVVIPTQAPTGIALATATRTPTRTANPTVTRTPTRGPSPTRTATPAATETPVPSPTLPEPSPTLEVPTATRRPTNTATVAPSPTATWTPSATFTPSVTLTPTASPTKTPRPGLKLFMPLTLKRFVRRR